MIWLSVLTTGIAGSGEKSSRNMFSDIHADPPPRTRSDHDVSPVKPNSRRPRARGLAAETRTATPRRG
ncbi:hypothetical protein ACFPRL_21960 [Pseudoclavibacter helvolus]